MVISGVSAMKWMLAWLACSVALGQVEVRLEVRDLGGEPMAGVRIADLGKDSSRGETSVAGLVQFTTDALMVHLRRDGYEPVFLNVERGGAYRVEMKIQKPLSEFRACKKNTKTIGLNAGMAKLRFPLMREIAAQPQGSDVDYVDRVYLLKKSKAAGIGHGSGHAWSFGKPTQGDFRRSVSYQEKVYPHEDNPITDARGVDREGKHWRYLGRFFESASYRGVDASDVEVLDRMMDGACLQ